MKSRTLTTVVMLVSFVILVLSLKWGLPSVLASEGRSGDLHVTKDCGENTGLPGGYCTIVTSNLLEIPAGSRVYYTQARNIPTGLLDSNVVLEAGHGDRALGRCTVEFATRLGLCTYSGGMGRLEGFTAEVKVSYLGGTLWAWDGNYKFKQEPER